MAVQTLQNQMKKLTRLRLINWQYFTNDTIDFEGATLISGYNATGKTTILDAIQLVLTTNTKKFNLAANEKGSRELKGYVRCKLGAESQKYNRTGAVPANVALEFYDETKESCFVIGVHLLSRNEDERVVENWYFVNARLEDLSFINEDGTPALKNEFLLNGKPINYFPTKKDAEYDFRVHLGHLDEKFGEMIQKAIAFRPMDNVKQFINDFLLPENPVDIEGLKANIQNMKELEELLEQCIDSKNRLSQIRERYESYLKNENDVACTEILLKIAQCKILQEEIGKLESSLRINVAKESSLTSEIKKLQNDKDDIENELIALRTERNNKGGSTISELEKQIQSIKKNIETENVRLLRFETQVTNLKNYLSALKLEETAISTDEFKSLSAYGNRENKISILEKITIFNKTKIEEINSKFYNLKAEIDSCTCRIEELNQRKSELELHKFQYPEGTQKLKEKILQEFKSRNIQSSVDILCDLLEIVPELKEWTNAVEGYLSSQKFYLVVEPKYYDIALEVYHRNNKQIHSVGIINTKKLNNVDTELSSLAEVVTTSNMYARRYVNYLLNRVIRVQSITELENYDIAITSDCMLYQGFVARILNPKSYKEPFIGQNAFKVQLKNVEKEIEENKKKKDSLVEKQKIFELIKKASEECKFEIISEYIDTPNNLHDFKVKLTEKNTELSEAQKNPELMEIQFKIDDKEKKKYTISQNISSKTDELTSVRSSIQTAKQYLEKTSEKAETATNELKVVENEKFNAFHEAKNKFEERNKKQIASQIKENFSRELSKYLNYRTSRLDSLKTIQREYIIKKGCDFSEGIEGISDYLSEEEKLEKFVIAANREEFEKAKSRFYEIFRADFLAQMKNNIDTARKSFAKLNKVLEELSYGEDKYEFKITFNRQKEKLYRMIMAESNMQGEANLWSNNFDSEFKDEIEELQEKLLSADNAEDKVVREYTDYRSYLDFDIIIKKIVKNDNDETKILTLHFSDISGEKSGGETQVPFYVAIAASFYQLYSFGSTARLILFDEAFEKMDEIRITSMMNLLKKLNLQVILITPPDKIDIIKDNVDSVIIVNRRNNKSYATELEY